MQPIKLTLETFNKTLNSALLLLERSRIPWFVCFGSLLGLVRDRGIIENDTDIDIGIPFEFINEKQIRSCFKRYDYEQYKIIRRDDIDRTLFGVPNNEDLAYISFVHPTLPCVDIFAWYLHDGIRYHTYDYFNEKKEHPSKYVFKGIREEWINHVDKSMFGTIKHPLFARNLPFPFMYGHLLDTWYPDWKTPRTGESHTPWKLELDSCRQFKDKKLIESQLVKSRIEYDNYIKTLT